MPGVWTTCEGPFGSVRNGYMSFGAGFEAHGSSHGEELERNGQARQQELDKLALTATRVDVLESALKISEAKYQELAILSEKRQEESFSLMPSSGGSVWWWHKRDSE